MVPITKILPSVMSTGNLYLRPGNEIMSLTGKVKIDSMMTDK